MRRHSIDHESVRRQIISVFTIPSRKRNNSTNGTTGLFDFGRRTRRNSAPDKKHSDVVCPKPELHTIAEVSALRFVFARDESPARADERHDDCTLEWRVAERWNFVVVALVPFSALVCLSFFFFFVFLFFETKKKSR